MLVLIFLYHNRNIFIYNTRVIKAPDSVAFLLVHQILALFNGEVFFEGITILCVLKMPLLLENGDEEAPQNS